MSSQQDALQEDTKACEHHVQKCRFVCPLLKHATKSNPPKTFKHVLPTSSYIPLVNGFLSREPQKKHVTDSARRILNISQTRAEKSIEFGICIDENGERSWCGGRKSPRELRELREHDDPINSGRVSKPSEPTSYTAFLKHECQIPVSRLPWQYLGKVSHVSFLDGILRTCVKTYWAQSWLARRHFLPFLRCR